MRSNVDVSRKHKQVVRSPRVLWVGDTHVCCSSVFPCVHACPPIPVHLSHSLTAKLLFPQASRSLKHCIRAPPTGHSHFTAVCKEAPSIIGVHTVRRALSQVFTAVFWKLYGNTNMSFIFKKAARARAQREREREVYFLGTTSCS